MRTTGPRLLAVVVAVLAVVGVVGLALGGTALLSPGGEARGSSAGPRAAGPASTVPAAGTAGRGPLLGRSIPVSLDVPAIGVRTSLLTLGLDPAGAVEVPPLESREAGWYEHSPTPGEQGPAVLLGHVDSARSGPGVFFDLPDLRPGDAITVGRADGSTAAFLVDRVVRYPKAAFPTEEVYGDLDHAGLRLITCGGAFDHAARSYLDNVIVFASATTAERAG